MQFPIAPLVPPEEGPGGFELVETDTGWFWRLRADNGELLCHSEEYVNKHNAERGIKAARKMATRKNVEKVNLKTKEN